MEDIGRRWRKSSYSGNGGECVEVGHAQDVIVVRDTSQDQAGPVLRFSPAAWRRFASLGGLPSRTLIRAESRLR